MTVHLTQEQRDRIARIVCDKDHPYIDIRSYGGDRFDEEWLELVQDFADATAEVRGHHRGDVMGDAEERYLTMRNVARRFQKRWTLVVHPERGHCWRHMVGGYETLEPCLPGEVDAVGELDAMGRVVGQQVPS